jgi:hypothetical protein
MAWIITSSARDVEQYCGFTRRAQSSTCGRQHRQSRRRASGPRNNGVVRNRAYELKESCSLATAASREEREQIETPSETTYWVSFMIKLLRAYGGCLGARRR